MPLPNAHFLPESPTCPSNEPHSSFFSQVPSRSCSDNFTIASAFLPSCHGASELLTVGHPKLGILLPSGTGLPDPSRVQDARATAEDMQLCGSCPIPAGLPHLAPQNTQQQPGLFKAQQWGRTHSCPQRMFLSELTAQQRACGNCTHQLVMDAPL